MSGKRVISPQNYEQTNNNNGTEETNNKRYLHQLDMGLEKLKEIVTSEGHAVKIFISHAWHEDALQADERNNPDLVRAAKYYDSLCWWLYEALTKAGFMVIFDLEQRKIRSLGAEGFMAKSVDESDVVLSVCTKLYHDRSEIASTGVGKEVNHIRKRIVDREGEGLGFLIPLLVHYDQKDVPASELIPATLQSYNPIYVDGRNRETYVSNLWRVLAELFNSMSNEFGQRHFLSLQLKKAYVSELSHLLVIPDSFSLMDGSPVIDEDVKRSKESVLATFDKLILLESQQDSVYSFIVSHPFHKMRTLANLVPQGTTVRTTPYKALRHLLNGKRGENDELYSQICDAVFLRALDYNQNPVELRNWMSVGSCVLPVQNILVDFGSDVKAACRMYGVSYLWFCWLDQINDSMIYDQEILIQLSAVFVALYECVRQTESTELSLLQAVVSILEAKKSEQGRSVESIFTQRQVYAQRIQLISIGTMTHESALRMFHLVSISCMPDTIDLRSETYKNWKSFGQQYLDYFFAKKMLSIEKDANTDHYLRLATRLGCQPSLKQWDEFIDQVLLCRDEERCEEDERILLGFVRELKMNMKSVMHHRDNKDRKIVEKIAEYIIKHRGASRNEKYRELERLCPELEWQEVLSCLIPKELQENVHGRRIVSLSGERCLKEECFLQLYNSATNTFKPKDTNHNDGFDETNGRHVVAFVKNHLRKNVLCFKLQPEFPMIEQAGLELMYGLFGYPGIPFSEVMKWNVDRKKREGSQLFLVSAYVEGIRADEVFSNADHADMINKLDEQRVGELIIYSILSNPEDGRLQNYIFVRSDRDASLYKIVAIDIDHSFAAAIPQKLPGWFSKETKTSSMLFTLPLMSEPIAESIQERLRKLDVDELFVGWLDDLERLEHEYRKLYNENEEERAEYETTTTLTLPMNYARLMHVYWKLKELKSFVMDYERTDETPQPTYMEALKRVEKYTGDRYEAVNESTLSVGERFKKSDGRLSSSMIRGDFRDYALRFNEKKKGSGSGSTALDTIAQVRESLRQKKQQHQKDIEEFEKMKEEFKRLSAAEQEELFVSYQSRITSTKAEERKTETRRGRGETGRGNALDDLEIERKWLDLVSECVCEWQRLIIRHNGVLRKSWFVDAPKTAFYNLTLLELHDCSEVTGEVLDILSSQKSCRLEGVILSSLENLRTLCARGVFGWETNNPLELPDLRSIRFINNFNLKRIHIKSAKLRHLVIQGCFRIEWMSFGDVHSLKSLQYDDFTINRPLPEILQSKYNNIITSTFFENNNPDSSIIKNVIDDYLKVENLYDRFLPINLPSSKILQSSYNNIITLFKNNNPNPDIIQKAIEDYPKLENLYDHFLTINRPSSEILQSSYNNIITLFKNNNPNPQIIKNEIDNYPRIESLYEQFLKDEDNWGQQYGISDLKNSFDYYRFINGKLVFKDPNEDNDINMREFSFRQFANKLEGEFVLSELKDNDGDYFSDYLSINIGYRKQRVSSHIDKYGDGKTEVWIVPKFMVEKDLATSSSNHLEWYLDKWSSPVGIFFTRGDWDDFSSNSRYITNQQYNQINNQTLYNLYQSSEKRIISDKDILWYWPLMYFSFVF